MTHGTATGYAKHGTKLRRPAWTQPKWAAVRLAIYERDLYTCRECGWWPPVVPEDYDGRRNVPCESWLETRPNGTQELKFEALAIDHIVPIHHGGTNDLENLQTLCGTCNSRKGHRVAT